MPKKISVGQMNHPNYHSLHMRFIWPFTVGSYEPPIVSLICILIMYLKHIEHLNADVERFLYMIDPYEDELDHLSDNGNLSKIVQ